MHLFPQAQAGCKLCGVPGQKPAVALISCAGSHPEQERLKLLGPVLDLLSSAHARHITEFAQSDTNPYMVAATEAPWLVRCMTLHLWCCVN